MRLFNAWHGLLHARNKGTENNAPLNCKHAFMHLVLDLSVVVMIVIVVMIISFRRVRMRMITILMILIACSFVVVARCCGFG